MSLHAKRRCAGMERGRFGAIDEKLMKRAEGLLFGELSVALDIPKEAVPEYIASEVGGQKPQTGRSWTTKRLGLVGAASAGRPALAFGRTAMSRCRSLVVQANQ